LFDVHADHTLSAAVFLAWHDGVSEGYSVHPRRRLKALWERRACFDVHQVMSADPKVHRAAALLVERDGLRALDVAMLRAKSCASRRDREGAMVWTIIAEEIAAMIEHSAEPRFDDVLAGLATKA